MKIITVIRKSNVSTPEDFRSQQQDIKRCLAKHPEWKVVHEKVINGTPRFDMLQKEARPILDMVDKYRPDYLLFGRHNRIGFEGVGQLGWIMTELRGRKCNIWLGDKDKMLDDHNPVETMMMSMEQSQSDEFIKELSRKVQDGHVSKAVQNGSSAAGTAAYGYDSVLSDRRGVEICRITYDGKREVFAKDADGEMVFTYVTCRTVVYPNGRQEKCDDEAEYADGEWQRYSKGPRKAKQSGERRTWSPNPEQSAIVKDIFRMGDEPLWMPPHEIAAELNSKGIKSPWGGSWRGLMVDYILRNPLYKGEPAWNRGKKPRKRKGEKLYPDPIPYSLSDAEKDAIRIVTDKQWKRINAHLDTCEAQKPEPHLRDADGKLVRRRVHDNAAHWLRRFIRCGCDDPTCHIWNAVREHSYHTDCGSINIHMLHSMINKWIADKKLPEDIIAMEGYAKAEELRPWLRKVILHFKDRTLAGVDIVGVLKKNNAHIDSKGVYEARHAHRSKMCRQSALKKKRVNGTFTS